MLKVKNLVTMIISMVCVGMATIANGSASTNFLYQPEEPKGLDNMLSKKKL